MSKIHRKDDLNVLNIGSVSPYTKELDCFKAIYRQGSISRASEFLSIDQGNLSKILKKFEEKIEAKLFIRHRGGLKPTPISKKLFLSLSDMDIIWDKFNKESLAGKTTVNIVIGVHQSIAHTYLGRIISYLNKHRPEVYIDIVFNTSLEVTRKVQKRELDLAIVANPIKSDDLVIKSLASEKIFLCALDKINSNFVLLRNPQMLFLDKVLKKIEFKRVIDISDYDIAASLCLNDNNFCCIIPSSVQNRHQKLKVLNELKNPIPIKLISYPGSNAIGLMNKIIKACSKK